MRNLSTSIFCAIGSALTLSACFLIPKEESTFHGNRAKVFQPLRATSISVVGDRACALDEQNQLLCWGENRHGILGSPAAALPRATPIERFIENRRLSKFSKIVQNETMICGMPDQSGAKPTYCWGAGGESMIRTPANWPAYFSDIAMGQGFGCGLTDDGQEVLCFGPNDAGRANPGPGLGTLQTNSHRFGQRMTELTAEGFNGQVYSMVQQEDGRVVVAGAFTTYGGHRVGHIARLLPDGRLDTSFNVNGTGFNTHVQSLALLGPDAATNQQNIVAVGSFSSYNDGVSYVVGGIVILRPDGSVDDKFRSGNRGFASVLSYENLRVAYLPSTNKIIVVGDSLGTYTDGALGSKSASKIVCLNADGTFDDNFQGNGTTRGFTGAALSVVTTDDRILVGGRFTKYTDASNSYVVNGLVKLHPNGSLDTSFLANSTNSSGFAGGDVMGLAVQSDGAILVGGKFTSYHDGYSSVTVKKLVRLNNNGAVDVAFMTNLSTNLNLLDSASYIRVIKVLQDGSGRILIGGHFIASNGGSSHLARLNASGTTDSTFVGTGTGNSTSDIYSFVEMSSDPYGRILVGGIFTQYQGEQSPQSRYLISLNPSGSRHMEWKPPQNFQTIISLQAAGWGACALVQSDLYPSLYCWGHNGFDQFGGGESVLTVPGIAVADVETFFLTPSRLCYLKNKAQGQWYCRGANYSSAMDEDGSNDSGTWLGNKSLIHMAAGFTAEDLAYNKYEVSAATEVLSNGVAEYERFVDMPFGCLIKSGALKCHGLSSALRSESLAATRVNRGRVGGGNVNGTSWNDLSTQNMFGANRAAQSFSLGRNHGCMLTVDNYVHCWGDNRLGQGGVGDTDIPTQMSLQPVVR